MYQREVANVLARLDILEHIYRFSTTQVVQVHVPVRHKLGWAQSERNAIIADLMAKLRNNLHHINSRVAGALQTVLLLLNTPPLHLSSFAKEESISLC